MPDSVAIFHRPQGIPLMEQSLTIVQYSVGSGWDSACTVTSVNNVPTEIASEGLPHIITPVTSIKSSLTSIFLLLQREVNHNRQGFFSSHFLVCLKIKKSDGKDNISYTFHALYKSILSKSS